MTTMTASCLVGAGDALRPLLDLLLARGFDPNATENVVARGGGVGGAAAGRAAVVGGGDVGEEEGCVRPARQEAG